MPVTQVPSSSGWLAMHCVRGCNARHSYAPLFELFEGITGIPMGPEVMTELADKFETNVDSRGVVSTGRVVEALKREESRRFACRCAAAAPLRYRPLAGVFRSKSECSEVGR